MTTGWPTIWRNGTIRHFQLRLLRHIPFWRIVGHPEVMEGRAIAHWNRLTETSRMVLNLTFYDHWMAHNSTKRQWFGIFILFTAPHAVLLNYAASSGRVRSNYSSLDSSHRDDSNGGEFGLPSPLDAAQFNKTICGYFTKLWAIQWSWKAKS